MPILKSAIKKLRADRKKRLQNRVIKSKATRSLDVARKTKTAEALREAFSAIDRAAKSRVFHPKKADRLKSRTARLYYRIS